MRYDFIEIGTCDFDTLCQSCEDWQIGISVDAVAGFLDNLPNRSNVKKINAAISTDSRKSFIYTIPEDVIEKYNLPWWVRGCSKLGSPNNSVVRELESRSIQEGIFQKIEVETIPISDLLERNSVTGIGVFKTDLEGHDIKVINSLLDYGKVLPDRIIFEHNPSESNGEFLNSLIERLEEIGYKKSIPSSLSRESDHSEYNFSFDLAKEIMIVSMYNQDYSDIAEITIFNNFQKYCSIHGYKLKSFYLQESDRAIQWSKISLLKDLILKESADWFFFVDADCLFMNHSRRLEEYIDEEYFMLLPSGGGSPDHDVNRDFLRNNIMSSQMLVKNCQESLDFINEIWEAPDWPIGMSLDEFDHEMRQIRISYSKPKWNSRIKILEEKLLNTFWPVSSPHMVISHRHINFKLWNPGDFIVHVTGIPRESRSHLLKEIDNFRGGLISQWSYEEGKIFLRPLVNLEKVKIIAYDIAGLQKVYWEIENLDTRSSYWIYVGEDLNIGDYVFKAFDNSGRIICTQIF